MKKVTLQNATYRGQVLNGEFEMVKDWRESPRSGEKDGIATVMMHGEKVNVCVNFDDIIREPVVEESYDSILTRISKRFNILERMTSGVINGNIRSLIVAGAPGVGKTFTVERMLKEAQEAGTISFDHIKGHMTAIGLYKKLFESSDAGSVIVIDDCDGIFKDETALNLLKGALDSSDERWISWNAESKALEAESIPNKFKFCGTAIFISNLNFQAVIDSGSSMAPHMDALISRSIYLDLALHDRRAVMARVEDLSLNTPMLFRKGLTGDDVQNTIDWLKANVDNLRELSLRTALKLAGFVKTDDDWQEIAEVTLLK